MTDPTAGRSAETRRHAELDPTRPCAPGPECDRAHESPDEPEIAAPRDVTAGRSAGTAWNAEQDPTRGHSAGRPRTGGSRG